MSTTPRSTLSNHASDPPTREEMLCYLRERHINDERVLQAMTKVPRHRFVPREVEHLAYGRRPLSIGYGQTISTPYIVASMTELLLLNGGEKVLEIGTGCGYQTAVLCEMGVEVYSIEIVPEVAAFGANNLAALGYAPHTRVGDGADGWLDQAPFDRLILAATSPRIPETLLDQLGPGGIAVGPEQADPVQGTDERREVLVRYRRTPRELVRDVIYGVRFVPMTGKVRQSAPPKPR